MSTGLSRQNFSASVDADVHGIDFVNFLGVATKISPLADR
jgi:hypothetical protein